MKNYADYMYSQLHLLYSLCCNLSGLCAQRFYVATCCQLRRIDFAKRSPIYVHFSETLSGLSSVRAYKKTETFIQKCDKLVDENQMAYYPNIVSNRYECCVSQE